MVLKCEARVAKVARLSIFTSLLKINVDDINSLRVIAFDEAGAAFASVAGFRFDWRAKNNDQQSLKIIQSSDTLMKTSGVYSEMERQNWMTDIAFLKGQKTGTADIEVRLIEPGYESVARAAVKISVIEPFTLIPSFPIYVLPNSEFTFKVCRLRPQDGELSLIEEVTLPSEDFEFSISEEGAGTVDQEATVSSSDQIAVLTMTARDTTIENNSNQGIVHVVDPDRVEMELIDVTEHVKDGKLTPEAETAYLSEEEEQLKAKDERNEVFLPSWILVEKRFYVIKFFLFDKLNHKIRLTSKTQFKLDFASSESLAILEANDQNSKLLVEAKKEIFETKAVGKIVGGVASADKLVSLKSIQITSQISIDSPVQEIRLPYLGYFKEDSQIG
jgi:hypothetical protein